MVNKKIRRNLRNRFSKLLFRQIVLIARNRILGNFKNNKGQKSAVFLETDFREKRAFKKRIIARIFSFPTIATSYVLHAF